jgi:hypothetical protein
VNRREHPEIPQDMENDDLPESQLAQTELTQTAITVLVTLAVASAVLVAGIAVSGVLHDVLLLTAPAMVFIGAMVTAVQAYRCNRAGGRWQVWQGGMWLLMVIFLTWIVGAIPAVVS